MGVGEEVRSVGGSGPGPPQGCAQWADVGQATEAPGWGGAGFSRPPPGVPESRPPAPQTGEEHTVTHLQYVAWPDHGVPDDSSDFLEFVNYVRSLRADAEPVLVHCR